MPAQWKTIGPLVGGRSSVQCQERYEQLLDEAAAGTGAGAGDDKLAGLGGEGEEGGRKLRAGDIDPHPETKPARPDPIDMDEDEIEMLQEARARLANTQGKKAKRKAREKMLNEAKRLADLQKRRELKQAGLLSSSARVKSRTGKRGRREIDFGVEIPFHKPAPAGFHSTGDEDQMADEQRRKRMKAVDFKQINEAQYRSRDREEKNAKKKEEARLRNLERSNMQYVVAQVSKKNDPIAARKRGMLSMPEPTVTDGELEKVAKITKEQRAENEAMMALTGGASATDALLGDYTDRPLPTPMRTPMTGSGMSSHEVIMREASNLRMLERGQTPLLGDDNPMLLEGGAGTGVGKSITDSATPLPGNKSMSRGAADQTPMTIGRRDQLGLNRPNSEMRPGTAGGDMGDDVSISATSFATSVGGQSMSIREMAKAERRAMKRARKELEVALANLPAPQFEYELAAPDMVTDDDDEHVKMTVEKDAAELEAEEMARLDKEAAKLYEARSSVVKRVELPRPMGAITDAMVLDETGSADDQEADADAEVVALNLVRNEMLQILQHDAYKFPVLSSGEGEVDKKKKKDKKKKSKSGPTITAPAPPDKPLELISNEAFLAAQEMLNAEVDDLIQEKRSLATDLIGSFESDLEMKESLNLQTIKSSIANDTMFDEQVDKLQDEFNALAEAIKALRKQNDKMEQKLSIKNGGYVKRCSEFNDTILKNFAEIQNSKIEESVYKNLMGHEQRGMTVRIEKLQDEIQELQSIEARLQKQYGDLSHEKNRHKILIRQKEQAA